jgi:hypothetical protein
MLIDVHAATTMLRGDGRGYNPREIVVTPLPGGEELLTGAFVDDGPRDGHLARRPERPFWITTHFGFEAWSDLNARVFHELEHGPRDVMIGYRPQPQHVLVCPTCRAFIPIELPTVAGHGHLTGVEWATCSGCGRNFTSHEIDERGTWL